MTLPSKVQEVLDEWNVDYTLAETASLSATSAVFNMPGISANTAQISILEDDIGRIQVIYPASHILDLNKLEAATSRQLWPLDKAKVAKIQQGLNLETIPALPQVTGLDTYVDEALLELDSIEMWLNDREHLQISMNDFQTLVSSARVGSYCATIPKQEPLSQQWAKTDISQINNVVRDFTQLRVSQRLEETLDMPPMPETAQKIIDLRMDPDAETDELAKLVNQDPGLAAQVISWANSPYYGVASPIVNVQEAVVRVLGFDLVINLALGLSLGRTLEVPKDGPQGYTPFWQQSVYTAAMMSELVRALPPESRPSQGIAYLCGLLHNFGFLILGHVFPPHFKMVNRHIDANPQINRYYLEQHLMKLTREQISSNLFNQWGLPEEVCTAIRYQNEPAYDGKHCVLSKMLYVSSRMLRQYDLNDAPFEPISDEIISALNI
ncbi:MAG: HD-like signal output (HDOD) protein/prolyl-tRNA editing enzyme YbaK/EbsC (Cys-tRNA(Pro) deacylase), partial [Bermanella sp.]